MDKNVLEKISQLIYRESGITLGDKKEALMINRLSKRFRELGISSEKEYLKMLNAPGNEDELINLLDVISTNVTHFFREDPHFDVMKKYLTKWVDGGQTRFRIWCAAASTGEEPYSLAITAHEALGNRLSGLDFKILSTDISTNALAQAKRGVYKKSKMDGLNQSQTTRFFTKTNNPTGLDFEANDSIKDMNMFKRLNLVNFPYPLNGNLDMIFCRNVMIYFDNETRARIIAEFYRLLRPGGILMVGHSEGLTGMLSTFTTLQASTYMKS